MCVLRLSWHLYTNSKSPKMLLHLCVAFDICKYTDYRVVYFMAIFQFSQTVKIVTQAEKNAKSQNFPKATKNFNMPTVCIKIFGS